jgi:hypothetical protein
MMSCNVHNHRREAFLKAQREADAKREALEAKRLAGLFDSTLRPEPPIPSWIRVTPIA